MRNPDLRQAEADVENSISDFERAVDEISSSWSNASQNLSGLASSAGAIADRRGPRAVIALGAIVVVVSFAAMGLFPGSLAVLIGREVGLPEASLADLGVAAAGEELKRVDLADRAAVFALLHGAGFSGLAALSLSAQSAPLPPKTSLDDATVAGMRWRNIGPARGGRSISAVGSVKRPNEYWFAATGGGLQRGLVSAGHDGTTRARSPRRH